MFFIDSIMLFVSYGSKPIAFIFRFSDGGEDAIFGPAPTEQPDRRPLEPEEDEEVPGDDLESSEVREFFPETWIWEVLRTK